MDPLPAGFAKSLAQVLAPGEEAEAAAVIKAAARLDDDGLRVFLELFAERLRSSPAPVTHKELRRFLIASGRRGRAAGP
jgi:hypothetical protein